MFDVDCMSSDPFDRGQMQKRFKEATYARKSESMNMKEEVYNERRKCCRWVKFDIRNMLQMGEVFSQFSRG